jgi:hydroxyacylglutathione hydrolase
MWQIHPIPAFDNNYFWLLQPDVNKATAYIIDPGAAAPVIQALNQHALTLAGILITHHHHDHIDGASELSQTFKAPIYGPHSSKIQQVTHPLSEGDQLLLGHVCAQVLAIPGHTRDHIGYFIDNHPQQPLLLCGDTLFAGGCGRLFDGTAEQLFHSLQRIATLPDNTLIYCAHEYTLSNIQFAQHIEPDNKALITRKIATEDLRRQNTPSIPSNLGLEKLTNPFLRCHIPAVHARVEQLCQTTLLTPLSVFTQLRLLKDETL